MSLENMKEVDKLCCEALEPDVLSVLERYRFLDRVEIRKKLGVQKKGLVLRTLLLMEKKGVIEKVDPEADSMAEDTLWRLPESGSSWEPLRKIVLWFKNRVLQVR